jgi:histidinol-phosphatase
MPNATQADLNNALRLADIADEISSHYFMSSKLTVNTKPDMSPVTEADIAVEKALSQIVREEFKDGYLGEEGTREGGANKRTWIIDPIDGTKNFMRGMPIWGSLIALLDGEETIVGVVSCPALGRRWWAGKGMGSFTQDVDGTTRELHVSGVDKLENTFVLFSNSQDDWDKRVKEGMTDSVRKLLSKVWRERGVGDMFNYMLVAEGAADVCFEAYCKQWDIEAPKLIVTEAGGQFWTNATPQTKPDEDRATVATNGKLHEIVLKELGLN